MEILDATSTRCFEFAGLTRDRSRQSGRDDRVEHAVALLDPGAVQNPKPRGPEGASSRDRTVRLLVCWIRPALPRRTTAALAAASGEEGCRPAPETLLDSGSSSWTGGAESRARTDQAGSARDSSAWRSRNMRKSAGSGRVTRYRNTYVLPSSPMPIGSLSVNWRTVCPASDENVSDGRSANGTRCVGRKVGDLLSFGREPLKIALPEDSVEHHQPFDCATQRKRPAMPIVGLANRRVQRLVMKVVKPGRVVPAATRRRVPASHDLSKEVLHLLYRG